MPEITKELVHYLWALSPKDLTPEAVDRAKYFLLDYLGVTIRGSQTDSAKAVCRMIQSAGMAGPSSVIGTAFKTSPGAAALANGTSAHSIELDDTHQAGSIHLGVVMYSVAIALTEYLPNIDFERFATAVVAGYETAARLGMAVQPKEHYGLGFHPTATCGVFGAAVTASKLLGLNEDLMLSAFGIAGSMAAGSLEFLADGAWTKRLHPGLAAQNGIQAALLAAEGFRGPGSILEGRDGFLAGYSRNPRPELVTCDLGQSFEILRTAVKPHACCRYMQTPIDALIELGRKYDIQPDQVTQIEVAVLEAGWSLVAEPKDRKYRPEGIVDAQFSMPFGAAVAILDRSAGMDAFTEDKMRSAEVRRLMSRVVLVKDARIEKNFPAEWRSRVVVYLENGEHYENYVRYPKGDPENPLSWDELAAKFRALAGGVLPAYQCSQIESRVRALNESSELRPIWGFSAASPA